MYGFQNIGKTNTSSVNQPSEALIWNWEKLDELIPQYRTLNVDGRETYTRAINSIDVPRDGSLFTNSFLDNRVITVKFSLMAKTNLEFNLAFDKLKALLQGEEVPFQFADEAEYIRYGTVKTFTNSNPGRLSIVGSFDIEMTRPFKYSSLKTVSATDGNLTISDANLSIPVKPEKVIITGSGRPLVMFGSQQRIELDIAYPASTTLVIDLLHNSVTRSGVNEYQHVTLSSDIADLKIFNGMQVTSTAYSNVTVQYRNEVI